MTVYFGSCFVSSGLITGSRQLVFLTVLLIIPAVLKRLQVHAVARRHHAETKRALCIANLRVVFAAWRYAIFIGSPMLPFCGHTQNSFSLWSGSSDAQLFLRCPWLPSAMEWSQNYFLLGQTRSVPFPSAWQRVARSFAQIVWQGF